MTGKKALLSTLIPLVGLVLRAFYCWGHPLATIGTIVIVAGFPLSIHWALRALRESRDRPFAIAALVVSLGGAVLLIGWLVMGWTASQSVM